MPSEKILKTLAWLDEQRCLGVTPGSVCAFGLINDIDVDGSADPKELFENGHRVKYFLDMGRGG